MAQKEKFEIFRRCLCILFRIVICGEQGMLTGIMRLMAHDTATLHNRQMDGFASLEQPADVADGSAVSCNGFVMTPEAQ